MNPTGAQLIRSICENAPQATDPLLKLPKDVIVEILYNLDIQNISMCSLVSKKLCLISTQENIWNKLFIRYFPLLPPISGGYDRYKEWQSKSNIINGIYSETRLPNPTSSPVVHAAIEGEEIFLAHNMGAYSEIEHRNLKTWENFSPFSLDARKITFLMTSNRMLFSGCADGSILVWTLKTKELMYTLQGHTGQIRSLTICQVPTDADSSILEDRLFSASQDSTIGIWDLKTGECLGALKEHTDRVSALVAKNKRLYAGTINNMIRMWDVGTGEYLGELKVEKKEEHCSINKLAICNQYLISAGSGDINIWDLETRELVKTLEGHDCPICSLFTTEELLITASTDEIKVWHINSWAQLTTISPTMKFIYNSFAFDDGKLFSAPPRAEWINLFDFNTEYKTVLTQIANDPENIYPFESKEPMQRFSRIPRRIKEKIYNVFLEKYNISAENFDDAEEAFQNGTSEQKAEAIEAYLKIPKKR